MCDEILAAILVAILITTRAQGGGHEAQSWTQQHFSAQSATFSFVFGDQASADLLPRWRCRAKAIRLDPVRRQHVYLYASPSGGLEMRCVVTEYTDFPALEWTTYFVNRGTKDMPILEHVQALDAAFAIPGTPLLHYALGEPQAVG